MLALPDILDTVRVVALPLRVRFRGITVREAALVQGPSGWAEFSPFVEYDDREAAVWLRAALEFATDQHAPRYRTSIPVNATVPAVAARDVAGILAQFPGCTTAKVKVAERGQTLADDVARVRAVREVLGPGGRIRIDANGAWSLDGAERALAELAPFDLEYAEQPCPDVPTLAALRARAPGVLIAADESIRRSDDPVRVVRDGAADLMVVKVQPLGGISSALATARATGLAAVVSSALDTSVGLAHGAHLAAALPALPYACGLGTASLLAADVTEEPLIPSGGEIDVRRIEPSPKLLARWRADEERETWWRRRIERCYRVVTEA